MTNLTWPRFRPVTYHWSVTLESDSGRHDLMCRGSNLLEVVERITDTEGAPIRAIVKVERLEG